MSVLLNRGSKDEKWVLENQKHHPVPATKLHVNIHKEYPKCPKSLVKKSWYSLQVAALFCTSSHVFSVFFYVLMKDPMQKYQFSPWYLKAKPAAFLTFLKDYLTFSQRWNFAAPLFLPTSELEDVPSSSCGWVGKAHSQVKIYPHPVQSKQGMTWEERKQHIQKTNNFPVKLKFC